MANHEYKVLSKDAIKYLCGLIRDLASVSEGIDNINLADDKTFSHIYIKNLINKCLQDANTEAQKLVGALTHLTCEETTVQPTLDNSEINVIYLYSANGNPPYQQFLKISEDKLVDLGSTSISLADYIKAADVAKDYATKVELKVVTDKIGTTTLTTTDTTITGAIEEVKGIADGKVDKTSIVTALDDTVTDEQVTSALLAKTELDKISSAQKEAVAKVNDSLSVIGKCKNLLNPTLQTTTRNGVTCTNNGDGTYTLNGTPTIDGSWYVVIGILSNCKGMKFLGCPSGGSTSTYKLQLVEVGNYQDSSNYYNEIGNGIIVPDNREFEVRLVTYKSSVNNNLIFKPMVTTNLDATYDDFVPYTGDGDTLTHDVAKLNTNLDELSTYSTEEKVIGKWVDGKLIYRRSLEIQLDGEPQKTLEFIYQGITALEGGEDISIYINQITPIVNLSEWNIDTMVKVYGHITDYTDTTKTEKDVDIPYPVTFNAQAYVTGWYNYKTKLYVVRVGEQYANKSTAFLTFEYTKK